MFLFNGVVHMYVGKVRRGVGFMLLGWFIYSVMLLFMIFAVGLNITQFSLSNDRKIGLDDEMVTSNNINFESLFPVLPYLFIFASAYAALWIVQAADASRLPKSFNRQLDKEETLLWY